MDQHDYIDQLEYEEFQLSTLMRPGEIVVSGDAIRDLIVATEEILHRHKYCGEMLEQSQLEGLRDELKLLMMGARP